jgi:large subunit ribosomal protein L4
MKTELLNIETGKASELSVLDSIFSLEPRKDVLSRVVRWQAARKQQGTHSVKTRSEGSYSKAKIYKQKGTGGARHGDRNAPIFRKGGVYKGPTPRSHEHKLNKKFRELGLRHALSSKAISGKLLFVDSIDVKSGKTRDFVAKFSGFGWKSVLIIDGNDEAKALSRYTGRLYDKDVLSVHGANVYDILKSEQLVITSSALKTLEERLK